jgi:hypothetical protein
MLNRTCENCGRRTLGVNHPTCDHCLRRQHLADLGANPFDPITPPRKASPARPYRLMGSHELEITYKFVDAETKYQLRKERKAQLEHFHHCRECQAHDQFYWDLDASDPRFMEWCHLLWNHGGGPFRFNAYYRVTRYKRIPVSYTEWCKTYRGDAVESFLVYMQELHEIPTKTSLELGTELWENPMGIQSTSLET